MALQNAYVVRLGRIIVQPLQPLYDCCTRKHENNRTITSHDCCILVQWSFTSRTILYIACDSKTTLLQQDGKNIFEKKNYRTSGAPIVKGALAVFVHTTVLWVRRINIQSDWHKIVTGQSNLTLVIRRRVCRLASHTRWMFIASVGQMHRLGYMNGSCMDSGMSVGKKAKFLGQISLEEDQRNDSWQMWQSVQHALRVCTWHAAMWNGLHAFGKLVQESQAKIVFPSLNDVLNNPIQQFNRDNVNCRFLDTRTLHSKSKCRKTLSTKMPPSFQLKKSKISMIMVQFGTLC